ncbi:MAG: prolipoprotein diacylglyceryl transferase family protein, partial [Chitinophagaceae bacterium]
ADQNRLWILVGAIFGALLGSRILGSLENPVALFHSSNPLSYFYENKTIVGGLLGGLIGVEILKKIIGENKNSGDLFVYPLILGMIIGRIGCFSMGIYEETYGKPSSFIFAMKLGDNIPRHPVALYEIFFLLLLWLSLKITERKYMLANGALFKLFMIAYLCFRFLLDFIKPHYTFSFGLSTIQIACLAGLIYYAIFIFYPSKLFVTKLPA